jgi:predicted enzyme related to lactoylglutathione lyase
MANKVDFFEIASADPAATSQFFGQLFDWNVGEPDAQMGYRMINGMEGGIMDTSAFGGGNWAIFYVHVDDVTATLAKAESMGATVAVPKTSMGSGSFAQLTDPQGNRFGVWDSKTE